MVKVHSNKRAINEGHLLELCFEAVEPLMERSRLEVAEERGDEGS